MQLTVFKPINSKLEKPSFTIEINDMYYSRDHYVNEANFYEFLTEIENLSYKKENFEKNLVLHCIDFATKATTRNEWAKFYKIPEENKIVMLVSSDIKKFKDMEPFTSKASIDCKKSKFSFCFVELNKLQAKELTDDKIKVPENWVFDENLTSIYNKYKEYSF